MSSAEPEAQSAPPPARRFVPADFWVAGAALVAEGAVFWALLGGAILVPEGALAHAAISAALWAAAIGQSRRPGGATPGMVLVALATTLFGPFGPAGALLSVGVRAVTFRADSSFEEWYAALFPDDPAPDSSRTMEGLAARADADGTVAIGPLMDVLSHGTRPQKQIAIAVLTRNFHIAFAPALRLALRDADNAIRVQAATSMATIENGFMKRAQALERAVREAPASAERLKALARHHDDYAATGLLDPVRAGRSRFAALRCYFRYLKLEASDIEARHAVARLLMRRRRYAFAAHWLELCRRDAMFAPNMAPWYMECLYRRERYADLRAFVRERSDELERLDIFPVRVVEAARLWSGRADELIKARVA